uniref:Trafficking protein particle complex subunit n=1 Tax=Tetradesmus obliquus TaxID=3088 RepID=A0A383VJ06_TETOB|eukprot:jgi/Sobl393_1/10307/SZX64923.1
MVCFNMYIFDRQGVCLHYQEWFRPKSVRQGAGTLIDDQKQMFGLFWTLSNFAATLDPKELSKPPLGTPRKIGQGCKWHAFTSNTYKLHFLESPSGIKVVLNTSPDVGDLRDVMSYIYDEIFVEYVVKNPLYTRGTPFKIEQFNNALNGFLRSKGLLQAI